MMNSTMNSSVAFQAMSDQPFGIHIVSYLSNGLGVLAIILNIIFLSCMVWIPNNDSAYNRFIKNLSVCDILGSTFFLLIQNFPQGPFAKILSENAGNALWLHGLPYIFRSIPWMFFTAYVFTLNCLTISQYLASCRPHVYVHIKSNRVVTCILLIVWLLAFLQILIPVLVMVSLSHLPVREAFKRLIFISKIEMVSWMVVYTTSICVSIFLNTLVYLELRRLKNKQMTRRRSSDSAPLGANARAKNEAFITILCLCLASVFCRLPLPLVGMLLIALIERSYGPETMSWVLVTVVFLLYLVFVVDPVIYILRMPDVRGHIVRVLRKMLNCMMHKSPEGMALSTANISVHDTGLTAQSTLL